MTSVISYAARCITPLCTAAPHNVSHRLSTDRQVAIPFAGMVSGRSVRLRIVRPRCFALRSLARLKSTQRKTVRSPASLWRWSPGDPARQRNDTLRPATLRCSWQRVSTPLIAPQRPSIFIR